MGMRTSGKQSSIVTQPFGRNSQDHGSEYSNVKIAASKLSKNKLKDESSLNKSSQDKLDGTNSEDDDSQQTSEDGNSETFVRTKAAANHNNSSMEEPVEDGELDTMKHNDKNIIAQGQPGVIGSSRDQSYASDNKSTLEKTTKAGPAEVKRRPVAANPNRKV